MKPSGKTLKRRLQESRTAEREARSGFKALMDAAADMIWIKTPREGRLLEANAAALKHLGVSREELLSRPIFDFHYHQDGKARILAWDGEVLSRGSGYLTATLRTKAGRPLEAELHGSVMEYGGGPAILVVGRVLADEARERRRAILFYEAFKRSNDVMFYCDRDGIILDVNDAFTRHYGWRREEAVGKRPAILRSRHSTDELYRRMWASIKDPAKGYWRGEVINQAKDGREIPLILTITAVQDRSGETIGYMSNAVDLTEQVALRERVAQAETLASIGEMAAVVAHEIRNPLGSIVMAAKQLAAGELSTDDREMVLQVLRGESQRLNEALSNFLSYARPQDIKFERADLNALLEEVCGMVRSNADLSRGIKLSLSPSRKLKPFPMDPRQIRQVVWNLVLNAVQALDGRGSLSVATGREPGRAFFKVSDTGPGIPPEKLPDIFKPFKTTKRQGTGLGLAIADRIVKAHGGRIDVEPRPGEGAAFTVWLPSAED